MSWFTEIAGKAEDLLNKVDQTAATALQNKTKLGASDTNIHIDKTISTDVSHYSFDGAYVNLSKTPISSALNAISKSSYNSRAITPRKKPESDDEKLLRFLNCEENLPAPSRKYKPEDAKMSPDKKRIKESHAKPVEVIQNAELMTQTGETNLDACSSTDSCKPEINILENMEDQNEQKVKELEVKQEPLPIRNEVKESNSVEIALPSTSAICDDISLANKRAEYAEAELNRMQKKLDHWNSQISSNDKVVRELREREKDMVAAIDAKDSQLAVLKVRLQEADQDLRSKQILIDELQAENQRMINEQADTSIFQNQTIESLRNQLQQSEFTLNKEQDTFRQSQIEHMQTMSKMEEEHRHLADSYAALQKNWSEINDRNKDVSTQLKNANRNLDLLQQEYSDYKQKAQRILQSKEKLIASLKEGNFEEDNTEKLEASSAILNAEVDGIKQENELLWEELRRANEVVMRHRAEIQELEKISQNDLSVSQEQNKALNEQLMTEILRKEETQLLNSHLKEELQFFKDDLSKTKSSLQSRIQDREIEMEKLRRQLTAKSLSTVSQEELESRLHALTENLIQKQTLVETLSTEKSSLVLQLERREQQLKEAQQFGSQSHTYVGVHNTEMEPKPVKSAFLENPFDSPFTRKVKRVYGNIDAFSIRLGIFFRRYPITRVFVIIYMLFLHFWVMIVLLTYEPEVHNSSYEVEKKI